MLSREEPPRQGFPPGQQSLLGRGQAALQPSRGWSSTRPRARTQQAGDAWHPACVCLCLATSLGSQGGCRVHSMGSAVREKSCDTRRGQSAWRSRQSSKHHTQALLLSTPWVCTSPTPICRMEVTPLGCTSCGWMWPAVRREEPTPARPSHLSERRRDSSSLQRAKNNGDDNVHSPESWRWRAGLGRAARPASISC